MSQWSESSEGKLPSMEDLSALADGELDATGVARACMQWRDDADSRVHWHAYQLIGDALRSEDLCASAHRDVAFLAGLRERLALEPVVLAPAPIGIESADSSAPAGEALRRRSWATPAAIAAGFVVVAGALVVTQMGGFSPEPPGAVVAQQDRRETPGVVPVVADAGQASAPAGPSVVLSGEYYRDVRMEEYFAWHKRFGGSSAPGGPSSGMLRKATLETQSR